MSPTQKIHALIPLYDLSWWQIFLITLFIDWAMLLILKRFEPLGWKRSWYWSSIFGDIFLPIGIASSAIVLRSFGGSNVWYASRVWNVCILIFGILLVIGLELNLVVRKRMTLKQQVAPSKLWHTLIFPVMFYFSVPTIMPLFVTHKPMWAFTLSLVGYGVWLTTLIHDWVIPPDFSRTH